jgi:hypothetical protein
MNMTPREFAQAMEQAKRDAPRLRREAIAAFWVGVATALARLWRHAAAQPRRTSPA